MKRLRKLMKKENLLAKYKKGKRPQGKHRSKLSATRDSNQKQINEQ